MPISFSTLKQDVVRGYRRHTFASGTVSSNSSTTAFIDTARTEPTRFWDMDGADTWAKFSTGSNNGLVRRVSGYSTNSNFTFGPAVTASLASGDAYALFKGPHPDNDVGLAINETLRATFPARVVSSIATTHEQEDVFTYSVASAVSSAITNLKEIRRSVGTINNDHIFKVLRGGTDFDLIDNAGATTLQLKYRPTPSLVLTLIGERVASELTADADTTDEPPAVILAGARHFLALQEGNAELASYWERKFEEAKKDYAKVTPVRELKRPHFTVEGW